MKRGVRPESNRTFRKCVQRVKKRVQERSFIEEKMYPQRLLYLSTEIMAAVAMDTAYLSVVLPPPQLTVMGSQGATQLQPIVELSVKRATTRMGILDALGKSFSNQDYSQSPGAYESTNARASHILVASESEAQRIKDQIAAGELAFDEAAVKYSTCASASRGGKLGKFSPGTMVKEFDDVVFSMEDTGKMDMGTMTNIYAPKYELDVVHGPVATKFGFHLVKIETRFVAGFDFRNKQGE